MSQNKKWALDTNVLFDLARNVDEAHTLREVANEKNYTLHLTPTCVEEMAHKAKLGNSEERKVADCALSGLAKWGISALEGPPESDAIAERFSAFLRDRGVLPQNEVNDGVILAEASLGGAALLVSSDSHLSQIDPDELRLLFEERGLTPIPVTTPMKLLRIFEKQHKTVARY